MPFQVGGFEPRSRCQCFQLFNPNPALTAWDEVFLPLVEKHAPIRRRVKHPTLLQWLSSEIVTAMKRRDRLKRDQKFEDYKYKKQKNELTSLVRAAKTKKAYRASQN